MSGKKFFKVSMQVPNDLSRSDINERTDWEDLEPLNLQVGNTVMFRSDGISEEHFNYTDKRTKASIVDKVLRDRVGYANRRLSLFGDYVDSLGDDPSQSAIAESMGIQVPDGYEIVSVRLDWRNGSRRGTRVVVAKALAYCAKSGNEITTEMTLGTLGLGKYDSYLFYNTNGSDITRKLVSDISDRLRHKHEDTILADDFSLTLRRGFVGNRHHFHDANGHEDISASVYKNQHIYHVPSDFSFHDFRKAALKAYGEYFGQFGLKYAIDIEVTSHGTAADLTRDATDEAVSDMLDELDQCIDMVEEEGYDVISHPRFSNKANAAEAAVRATADSLRLAAERCESRLGEIKQVADNVRVKMEQNRLPSAAQIF